jgi:hypothetical protein
MPVSSLNRFTVPLSTNDSSSSQGLLMPKLKYRFRVTLDNFGVPGTPTTELTKQVMNVTRPVLTFEEIKNDTNNMFFYLKNIQITETNKKYIITYFNTISNQDIIRFHFDKTNIYSPNFNIIIVIIYYII